MACSRLEEEDATAALNTDGVLFSELNGGELRRLTVFDRFLMAFRLSNGAAEQDKDWINCIVSTLASFTATWIFACCCLDEDTGSSTGVTRDRGSYSTFSSFSREL